MAGLPQVGDQVAHFTLTGRIAKGGMSTVYRARDERLGRDVALKVLSAELSDDGLFRERFERESRLAASISHPNILPIFDAGTWQGYLYISMLLVEGPDVAQLLEAGPLEPARANSIVQQVAAALDAAHAKSLVHRDVKPGNILLLEGAGPRGADHAYLADFGLTRHAASTTRLTRPDLVLGTVGYIAPELLLGHAVDARADQYSLACVTYEMLAGEPPFPRETDVVTIAAHLHEPPPRITRRRPELPSALDGIIARGMAKSPDDRFTSASAFAAAFQAGLRASGVMPLPVGAAAPPDLAAAHRRTVAF
ncbi:MAG: serine/threonine-protein kinase, partial [Candidatus Limnocylindrales bacterium]